MDIKLLDSPSACVSITPRSAGTHEALELLGDSFYCALIFHVIGGGGAGYQKVFLNS